MNKSAVPTDLLVVSDPKEAHLVRLIVRLPHSVADGTSMLIILHRILHFYDHPKEKVDVNGVLPEPAENLLPEITVKASKLYLLLQKIPMSHKKTTKRKHSSKDIMVKSLTSRTLFRIISMKKDQ